MEEETCSYSPPFYKPCHITIETRIYWIASMSVMNKEAHHLEQSQIASTNVVEIDLDILPAHFAVVRIDEFKALRLVVHLVQFEVFLRSFIEAVVILPRKQVDAHDTENQPKDEANQQHIHN